MSKRGDMNLYGAIIAFAIIVLLVPVLQFFQINQKAETLQDNIQSELLDVVELSAIINYDSVKYNNGLKYSINEQSCIDAVFEGLGFEKASYTYSNGDINISNADLKFGQENNSFILTYDMNIPFKIVGKEVDTVTLKKSAKAYFQKAD